MPMSKAAIAEKRIISDYFITTDEIFKKIDAIKNATYVNDIEMICRQLVVLNNERKRFLKKIMKKIQDEREKN